MEDELDQPGDAITSIYVRSTSLWEMLYSFRHWTKRGLSDSSEKIQTNLLEEKKLFPHLHPETVKKFYDENNKLVFEIDPSVFGEVKRTIGTAESAIDSASIVFAHSILEGVVLDLLELTRSTDPEAWNRLIQNKPLNGIKLRDVGPDFLQRIKKKFLSQEFQQMDRDSLLTKIETLFKFCSGASHKDPKLPHYKFDTEMIKEIDHQRHDIIHKSAALGVQHKRTTLKCDYLNDTSFFLIGLFVRRYKDKLYRKRGE